MTFETLNTTGFLFTDTTISLTLLGADFGDGYIAASLIGSPEGLRSWTIKIDVLPDNFDYLGQDNPSPTIALLLEDGSPVLLEDGSPVLLGGIQKPRGPDPQIPTGETRAEYLWQFVLRSKTAGDRPFWVWDPKTGKNYLASFVEFGARGNAARYGVGAMVHELSYSILCSQVYGTGLQLVQRRVRGVVSPI